MYKQDIILILIASFFYFSSPMLVTPLITGFTGELGASASLMGIVGGLMNLCSLLCRPFVGNLADKISKYKLSYIGGICMLAACLVYIFALRPALVVFARIVNGIGFACCSVCMSTWMSNMLPKEKIGSGMGVYGTMNALGMAIAPAIGVKTYQLFGYRTSFAIAAFFSLLIIIIIQFIQDKGNPQIIPKAGEKKAIRIPPLYDKKVIPLAVIIMLFSIPYCATQSFLVSYNQMRQLDLAVSLFFPFYAIVLLAFRLSLRNLFDKAPFKIFLFASSLSAAAGILLLAFMKNNFEMLLAAAFMAGGYGIMCSVCQSTAILLAGEGKRGLANSTYYIGLDSGMALGPFIGGLLIDHIAIAEFYPCLLFTIPIVFSLYLLCGMKNLSPSQSAGKRS